MRSISISKDKRWKPKNDFGRLIPTNDIWIAALARRHHTPVLSQDRHFDHVPGIQRIDW